MVIVTAMAHGHWRFRPVPRRAWSEAALWGSVSAGGAGAVALWWSATPTVTNTWRAELTGSGRLLGLIGGYLCGVLLVLLARVPLIENRLGGVRLSRVHAHLARYAVGLLLGQAVLGTYGQALTARRGVGQEATRILRSPTVALATVGLLLLLVAGIGSVRANGPVMSSRAWYLLHVSAYLAVVVACADQILRGQEFTAHPADRVAGALFAFVTIAIFLRYRLIRPSPGRP
jgi:hypothetical protein